MGYVGNEPSVNFTSFAKQDITGDGGASYTLTHAVANANEIEVFVNNVRQEPTEAYTVSGTALTMTGNVASTDDFYVIYLGKALQTTTPPDGSVSTAKIADDAVTSAKLDTNIAIDGDLTVDTSTLKVDSTNNRVGIGTASPATNLEVESSGDTTLSITAGGTSNDSKIDFVHGTTTDGGITYDHNGTYTSEEMAFRAGNNTPHMYLKGDGSFTVGQNSTITPGDGNNTVGMSLRGEYGRLYVSGTSDSTFNRTTDGEIIQFRSAGNKEGYIAVSGTTVSYAGGHLSRWSRLLDNSKDTTIVKGTVMTNLDEMVEWDDEDNEQLNKMAVSSVEGDANVAGVFVNWDNNDDWNDMNIAMTGDMVIRIAQGTTVARGDLLMSAGDGTAKPQGDDIVRSKTIAKVTSTNVSHTYDDGTYLVPCVLMAC